MNKKEMGNIIKTSQKDKEKNTDPLLLYLKQISKIKLLTIEEEREIGKQIVLSKKKLEELKLDETVTAEEINNLMDELKAVKNRMIRANLRLVVSIAKKYQYRGLSLLDLIDEGNTGHMVPFCLTPNGLGLGFNTGDGIENGHSTI